MDDPISAVRAALPDDLASELAVLFEASPRIVYRIGNTSTVAGGSPAIDFEPIPAGDQPGSSASDTPAAVAAADGGTSGLPEAVAPVADGGAAPADAPPPALASAPFAETQPVASFGGVPGSMLAGALLLACVIGLGVRKLGAVMLAGAGTCELGAIGGIALLRKGHS